MRRNILWNLAGMGLPLVLGAAAIPYLFRKIGIEQIGLLTLVWALIGYFSFFDFGLGRALTQQVSTSLAAGRHGDVPGLVKGGLLLTAATGLAGCILLLALAYPLGYHWLNVSDGLRQGAAHALLIAALGIPLTTLTTGLRGVLEGYQDFKTANVLRMLLGAANFGFPVLCVMWFGPSLAWMIASLIAARVIVLLLHFVAVSRQMPGKWRGAAFSFEQFKNLFAFGAWMTVSNIIGPLMVTADRFIISAVMGAGVVAYYTIPSEMLLRVLILPTAVTAVLFPKLASVMVGDPREARRLYRKCLLAVCVVLGPVCLVIALGAKWGLALWLGKEFAERSWAIVAVMAFGLLLNGLAQVPFAAIQASGNARQTAWLHVFEFIMYVPMLYLSMKYLGLLGAAIAWSIRVTIDLLALLFYAHKKSAYA